MCNLAYASLTIAVASNFQLPLERIIEHAPQYQLAGSRVSIKTQATEVKLVVASSGTLYSQAVRSAPFDVVMLANQAWPQQLVKQGLAKQTFTYAIGKLVLWPVSEPHSLQPEQARQLLQHTPRLALANPKLAPYGAAAIDYLNQSPVNWQHKRIYAQNVSQAFQFVDSGNANMGLLSESMLLQAAHNNAAQSAHYLRYYTIPRDLYTPIVQQLVVLTGSNNQALAQAFVTFLLSEQTQDDLSALGYLPVNKVH
ncbi:MAG: molybdate ABC transporter substrate-binding protein [Glaciecola sp.]